MKKKILSIAVVAAVAVAAAWGFNKSNNEVALADVALSNVEALAECERTGGSCWEDYRICCDAGYYGCSPCGY